MGYTVYWKNKSKLSQAELQKARKVVFSVYKKELAKDGILGQQNNDMYFHESFLPQMISNSDFEFTKTARKKYDRAVKVALLKLQEITINAYDISCDDGFKYTRRGLIFNAEAYSEDYRPIKKITKVFKLKDLPIAYETKSGYDRSGEYDWNANKKPKVV